MSRVTPTYENMLQRAFGDVISDADFLLQCAVLGLRLDGIGNKTVLEIGSGRMNRFTREAGRYVENAHIISINPQLAFRDVCQQRDIPRDTHEGSVAALAQGFLPFRNASFDTIVSVLGVPNSLLKTELPDLLNDVWRVMKPGGTARFWPITYNADAQYEVMVDNVIRAEPINEEVLALLPEPYCMQLERLVIEKPAIEGSEMPETIARLVVLSQLDF